MARIAGIDLPRNKKVEFALPYIYGIGNFNSKVGLSSNFLALSIAEEKFSVIYVFNFV